MAVEEPLLNGPIDFAKAIEQLMNSQCPPIAELKYLALPPAELQPRWQFARLEVLLGDVRSGVRC